MEINVNKEIKRITNFLQQTFKKSKQKGIVVAVSGGVDSATALSLVVNAIGPKQTHVMYLPFGNLNNDSMRRAKAFVEKQGLSFKNIKTTDITPIVHTIKESLEIPESDTLRMGNCMARTRMIALYDYAKAKSLLVCGTENKSEYHLGYFTRFGDEASDIEPIQHLYKTQVYQLAKALSVSEDILSAHPSANLWEGQTDEGEFGFTYKEADEVLHKYFDEKISLSQIESEFKNAKVIIKHVEKNSFKHDVPYRIGKK